MKRKYFIKIGGKQVWQGTNPEKANAILKQHEEKEATITWQGGEEELYIGKAL